MCRPPSPVPVSGGSDSQGVAHFSPCDQPSRVEVTGSIFSLSAIIYCRTNILTFPIVPVQELCSSAKIAHSDYFNI